MVRQRSPSTLHRSVLPTVIAGAGGAGAGYLTGRTAASATGSAVARLADALVSQSALSTSGPVIASGLLGAAVIVAAAVIPAAVVWTLTRKEQNHAKEEEDENPTVR